MDSLGYFMISSMWCFGVLFVSSFFLKDKIFHYFRKCSFTNVRFIDMKCHLGLKYMGKKHFPCLGFGGPFCIYTNLSFLEGAPENEMQQN